MKSREKWGPQSSLMPKLLFFVQKTSFKHNKAELVTKQALELLSLHVSQNYKFMEKHQNLQDNNVIIRRSYPKITSIRIDETKTHY